MSNLLRDAEVVNRDPSKIVLKVELEILHPSKDVSLAVRMSDWKRLTRMVAALIEPETDFTVWWSVLFGVSATCLIGWLPLLYVTDMPAWVKDVTLGLTVVSGVVGLFFFIRDRDRKRQKSRDANGVQLEIKTIEEAFDEAVD